jgi:Trypsin
MINDEEQICVLKNKQVWPLTVQIVEVLEMPTPTTVKIPVTTTFKSLTTTLTTNKIETTQVSQESSCGIVKKIESFGNFLSLPLKPGQFPWTVSIYRYFNDEEESYYKCAGTIIDRSTVLTSANCLLEDGLLLKSSDLQIYVSPFSLSAKKQKFKIYNVAEIVTHELFFFHLENNIAAVKLSRSIDFNDYVQPICLPEKGFVAKGKLGKVSLETKVRDIENIYFF